MNFAPLVAKDRRGVGYMHSREATVAQLQTVAKRLFGRAVAAYPLVQGILTTAHLFFTPKKANEEETHF